MPGTKKEKRSFAVYRSDRDGGKGELISRAKSTQWNKVAKKWGFHGLPAGTKNTWVRVELRTPGRGENPSKLYHLQREMVEATESYKQIATARGYKNQDMMPMVRIIDKATTLVPNKRKPAAKRASKSKSRSASAGKRSKSKSHSRSRSKSPAKKKKAAPKKKSSTPKKRSSTPKKKSTTPKKKRSGTPKKKSTTPKKRAYKKKSSTPKKK